MNKHMLRGLVALAGAIVACGSQVSPEATKDSTSAIQPNLQEDVPQTLGELAVWNSSVAAGECTGPANAPVPCWMSTHVGAARPYPALPDIASIVWGVKIGDAAWNVQPATIANWGVPATPLYDGTPVTGYSTDASVSYVKRDTFVVTAIVDSGAQTAKGAVVVVTEDAGRTWHTPMWVHRGCELLIGYPTYFWNARQARVWPASDGSNPYVTTSVGHYQCCPGLLGGPPSNPPAICGGSFNESAEFGVFAFDPKPSYYPAATLDQENDKDSGREDTHYLNFVSYVDSDLCLDILAEYPVTRAPDALGPMLAGNCPSNQTFDVSWRTKIARTCVGTFGKFSAFERGPDVDADSASPLCLAASSRVNSWGPAMAASNDGRTIATAVSIQTPRGQRIRATEIDASKWPPVIRKERYVADEPNVSRDSHQYLPSLAVSRTDDMALTWLDDRSGAAPGDFGALFGVTTTADPHVTSLPAAATSLMKHDTFATTGNRAELASTHAGLTCDSGPQRTGFAASITKGDRAAVATFQP